MCIVTTTAYAGPYIEYKHEHQHKDWKFDKNTEHLRLGYKAKNNLYFELGPMTNGHSYEAGYKIKSPNQKTPIGKFNGQWISKTIFWTAL